MGNSIIMTVKYDEFYKLFMEIKPDLRYHPDCIERGYTLDKLLGSDLVVRGPGNVDVNVNQFKDMLKERMSIGIAEPGKEKPPFIVFIGSTIDGTVTPVKQWYDVSYDNRALNYFNSSPKD